MGESTGAGDNAAGSIFPFFFSLGQLFTALIIIKEKRYFAKQQQKKTVKNQLSSVKAS